MPRCQICQREFRALRFQTEHIGICTRCVNTLNEFDEPAIEAEKRIREMLSRGMLRRAMIEQEEADEQWKRTKAVRVLNDLEQSVDQALPGWLNRLLADPLNGTRDFKQMRAQRRGLLRIDHCRNWTYPGNWGEVSRRIRTRDNYQCHDCGSTSQPLDVHHIIYLSKYGTNQQGNLVTLCRPCHEKVHGRVFDLAEAGDPDKSSQSGNSQKEFTEAETVQHPTRPSAIAARLSPTPVPETPPPMPPLHASDNPSLHHLIRTGMLPSPPPTPSPSHHEGQGRPIARPEETFLKPAKAPEPAFESDPVQIQSEVQKHRSHSRSDAGNQILKPDRTSRQLLWLGVTVLLFVLLTVLVAIKT